MPLYIKDPKVAEMAEHLQRLTKAPSKTEAVLKALERAIEEARRELLVPKLQQAVGMARRIGRSDDKFDQKAFSDEIWGL
jgi:antitoxin VapB